MLRHLIKCLSLNTNRTDSATLLKVIENYLTDHKQRVVVNGQTSLWEKVPSAAPQGTILELLFFSIYIRLHHWIDLFHNIHQQFTNWNSVYLQNICRWQILVFKMSRFQTIWKRIKQRSYSYQKVGTPTENGL